VNEYRNIRYDVDNLPEEIRLLEADIVRMDSEHRETASRKAILKEMKRRLNNVI